MKDFGTRTELVVLLFALTTMLGCGALDAGTPAAQSAAGLVATSSTVDFGSVPVGTTVMRTNTIANTSRSPIVLTRAQIDHTDFTITGQKLPLTLAPGQRTVLQIAYSPQSSGNSQSKVMLASNSIRWSTTFMLRGSATLSGRLKLTPNGVSFGRVQVGGTQTQSATLSNTSKIPITITRAAVSGKGFTLAGLSLPLKLTGGQSATMNVTFTPASGGAASGTISVVGTISLTASKRPILFGGRDPELVALNTVSTTVAVPVSGTGLGAGQLVVSPASLALGAVKIGASRTLSATLINSGSADLTVRQATITGRGFRMSGVSFPLTLAAGQRRNFSVTFTAQSAGIASGSIAVATDAPNPVVSVPVSAVATASAAALTSTPSSLNFGSVQASTPKTLSETLTNAGGSSLTISQANLSGTGFSLTGLNLPVALDAGQSTTFNVTFTPPSGSAASGTLSVSSNASNSTLNIPLVANAATVGVLSTSDSSLNFGSVPINGTASQSETLTNSGGANVTITQAKVSGTGFNTTGLNLPMTLTPGQSFTFGAKFTPTSGGDASGSISVVSDASDSTLTITLAATATVAGQLAVGPATLNFANVTVGQTKSLTASLTATGSSITVSGAGMSTSEFTISGLSLPVTLAAGKSASFTVTFKPQASGAASASGSFSSNASNPAVAQALTGTGTAAPQHSVALSWNPSTSSVVGYNVYRGSQTGGPYSKITSMNADTSFVDNSVQSGQTYFYVTTAVDGAGRESANSNQTQAAIPTP